MNSCKSLFRKFLLDKFLLMEKFTCLANIPKIREITLAKIPPNKVLDQKAQIAPIRFDQQLS